VYLSLIATRASLNDCRLRALRAASTEGSPKCCFLPPWSAAIPQPEWLIDRRKLAGRFPPRVRARELWRIPEPLLAEAQNDATILAIKAQEEAGLDIITDGEIRRESYSNRFATALAGIDIDHPGTALDRSGHPNPVPRIVGPIRRMRPVEVDDLKFLKRHTSRQVKMTVPGPFTMSQQAQNDFYPSPAEAAMDYAVAVNEEIRDLFAAGADIVQVDEPYMQARPQKAEGELHFSFPRYVRRGTRRSRQV
jgi:5-methyltetrahydropteroyltriglutamate--homocysteine methyltransferase